VPDALKINNPAIIRLLKVIAVGLVIAQVGLFWPYRDNRTSPRVMQAIKSTASSPYSVQEAAVSNALVQDATEGRRQAIIVLPGIVIIDAAIIYFFWNYRTHKPMS
jgi:hypothetical protein